MTFTTGCLICGAELLYSGQTSAVDCFVCGKICTGNAKCKNGHFVCDECHSVSAGKIIIKYCAQTVEVDPVKIANNLMDMSAIKMHGPEHHILVPCALIASYSNVIKIEQSEKLRMLEEAYKRGKTIPGGFCGFGGACGAGIGAGIFVSIIEKATPLSKNEWKLANEMTSIALKKISKNGGPRCCKRDTYIAIEAARDFIQKYKNITMPSAEKNLCNYSHKNKECTGINCIYNKNRKSK